MNCKYKGLSWGLLGAFTVTALLLPLAPAQAGKSARTQQYATAASLAEAALLYNYARRQNSTNGALALAGAAGTAYLWNQYSGQRHREDRDAAARQNYYRRRAAYYHRVANAEHRRLAFYHRAAAHRAYYHRRRI